MTTRAMQSNAHRKSQHEKTCSAVEFREISARARMKTPTRRPSTTPTMRPVDAEDSDDAVPGVTNLGVAALGALALANVALGILGIILLVLGMRESGHSAMDAMFANGGLNDTLFEKPDDAACVIGVLLMALSGYGLFGLWRRSKSVLMIYHVWALVAFIVVVYACAVMNIYKDASGAMVRSYWQTYRANHNITGVHFRAVGGAVVHMDDANWRHEMMDMKVKARLFLRTVASCLGASMFFLLTALGTSAYVMGLKYTGVRVGIVTNVAGVVFGLTLFVLCYFVAKSTYNVPDAISMKMDIAFACPGGVYEPANAQKLEECIRHTPDLIFQTTSHSGRRRQLLAASNTTAHPSPPSPSPPLPSPPLPSPPPPSPPPPSDWTASSVWTFEQGHHKVSAEQYNVTFKLALTGISGDDMNEEFKQWAAQKVASYGEVDVDKVYVSEMVAGAEHPIGGRWAPRLLAAAAFMVVFVNMYGLAAIYITQTKMLLMGHFFLSFVSLLLLVIGAALVGTHADATTKLISNKWHAIQNNVVGVGVEPSDAGAFARAHFKAAAALGTTLIILQVASMIASLFNYFSDEPTYSLLTPRTQGRNNGAVSAMFRPTELDSEYDEEYGRRGFLSQERASHQRRGSDGVVPLSNLVSPANKHFSID